MKKRSMWKLMRVDVVVEEFLCRPKMDNEDHVHCKWGPGIVHRGLDVGSRQSSWCADGHQRIQFLADALQGNPSDSDDLDGLHGIQFDFDDVLVLEDVHIHPELVEVGMMEVELDGHDEDSEDGPDGNDLAHDNNVVHKRRCILERSSRMYGRNSDDHGHLLLWAHTFVDGEHGNQERP